MQHSFLVFGLTNHSLKASVIEKKNNRVIFYQEYNNFNSADFTSIINSEKIYQLKFLQTYLSLNSSKHTLVPKQFFSQENQNTYLEFNNSRKEISTISNDYIPTINAFNVYENSFALLNTISLNNIMIMHQNSFFLNFCHLTSKLQKSTSLFISLNKEFFTLVIFSKENELLLSNSFEYKNEEDIAYHFFFSLEKLGLNANECDVNIYKNGQNAKKLVTIIDPFVKKIGNNPNPLKLNFSKVIPQEIIHSEYLLLTNHLCA